MRRTSRRAFLHGVGVAGAVGAAGCSGDSDDEGTATSVSTEAETETETETPTRTPTATPTATPESGPGPRGGYEGTLGFETMLGATPRHPEAPNLWTRYVDVSGVLADVEDENHARQLREGWLGSGPPRSTDSDAFELVHLQPGNRSNLTLGYGDFERGAAREAMRSEGWTPRPGAGTEAFDVLTSGGYAAAVGASSWIAVSAADPALAAGLADGIGTDPLVAAFEDVDREATSRAADEEGEYRVVERSAFDDGYAAGIAVNFGAYRAPVGVMHLAPGRGSEWVRAEERFHSVPGEIRTDDFDDEEPVV